MYVCRQKDLSTYCNFLNQKLQNKTHNFAPQFAPRFLASGEDQQSLSFSFRIAKSTIRQIIKETTEAIYSSLKDEYLTIPCSQNEWQKIAEDFENLLNFPHCIGALDGKHIRIECPSLSGSLYHNYKGFLA